MAIRVPITNSVTQADFTARISIGGVAVDMLLDTGSSVLAVDGTIYSPDKDGACKTTRIAQSVHYGSGRFVGAVVQAAVALSAEIVLGAANVAVTYGTQAAVFGQAGGIMGLAYRALDSGYQMPADTWVSKYDSDKIAAAPKADVIPYLDQLDQAGLTAAKFSILVRRSIQSGATADPTTDPLNAGIFVAGGGEECADLYTGAFARVAVVHEAYYNTNLLSVQVGDQPPIPVLPAAPGSIALSNSIIDSGTGALLLDQGLYDKILAAFGAIDPGLAEKLTSYGINAQATVDQTTIDLSQWPSIRFVFAGADGTPAPVVVAPKDYWQFDVEQPGVAMAFIGGDGNGRLGGQSILGLPIFTGHYVIFDRTATNGHGVVAFADQA